MTNTQLPIGVFDSGVGGLTVLAELQKYLPQERFLYLGDMARLPYGTKGPETVIKYAKQTSAILVEHGIKLLVIACNTASTIGLSTLQALYPEMMVMGVIEPGAEAACAASKSGNIGVIATEATVNAKGYQNAIHAIRPEAAVLAKSCGLFVPLAEEGWTNGPIVEAIAKEYLTPMLHNNDGIAIDCLVLGCTHYPALIEPILNIVGKDITVVDSAKTTAAKVKEYLDRSHLANQDNLANDHQTTFLVTDTPERFMRAAERFLKLKIPMNLIELVDISK